MAITTLLGYADSQNGNHAVLVLPDSVPDPRIANGWSLDGDVPPGAPPIPKSTPTRRISGPAVVAINELVKRYKAQWNHLAPSTREKLDFHFKVAARHFDFDRDVTAIRLADMRVLRSKLSEGRKPSTVNDILFKAIGGLFKLAVEDGLIERSPLEALQRARRGETDRQQPTWEQAQQIADEVTRFSKESGVITNFMRHFGIGQAEIKYLMAEHVDLTAGVIHFRRKKTGKPFDVPIFAHSKPFLERLKADNRLKVGRPVVTWRNPRKAIAGACERLEMPIYEPRALRRCFIVHCLESGTDPRLVAKWQGHKDAKLIFSVYGKHIDADHERREADKLR